MKSEDILGEFQRVNKYARWNENKGRRETWVETVNRAVNFLRELSQNKLSEKDYASIWDAMLKKEVMPSMRLLAMAGKAARRENLAIFNCSAVGISSLKLIADGLYISMAGCGFGYSVEDKYISQLPIIQPRNFFSVQITVEDSAEGWADAFYQVLIALSNGHKINVDYSKIRPKGSILKTKGGRSSGFQPLKSLFEFCNELFEHAGGRKLTSLEVHDIICKMANCVVSGGVRRSATLSLFDFDDQEMRTCKHEDEMGMYISVDVYQREIADVDKSFEFHMSVQQSAHPELYKLFKRETHQSTSFSAYEEWLRSKIGQYLSFNNQRWLANNSVNVTRKLTFDEVDALMREMNSGNSGEPGIVSELAIKNTAPERRNTDKDWVVNPCSEVFLRGSHEKEGGQMCNLTIAVARSYDSLESLTAKVRLATIIGTIQSLATKFNYISEGWALNTAEERLLGVDVTGQYDCQYLLDNPYEAFPKLKQVVLDTNVEFASKLGIERSAATTVAKPSGNSSVLLNCAAGIHPRYAPYYIRRVRINATDAVYKCMRDQGFKFTPENGQTEDNATTYVLAIPVKSPNHNAKFAKTVTAEEQLEWWKIVKTQYTEHNPSCTILYSPDELDFVIQWVYDNQDIISGISFLPRTDPNYDQLPYEEITEEVYNQMVAELPELSWEKLPDYESEDYTIVAQELACVAGGCDI